MWKGEKVYFIAGLNIDQYSDNSPEINSGELRLTRIGINGIMGCIQQRIISWNNKGKIIGMYMINRNIHGRETENHQNPVNTVNHVPSVKKCQHYILPGSDPRIRLLWVHRAQLVKWLKANNQFRSWKVHLFWGWKMTVTDPEKKIIMNWIKIF